MKNKICPTCGVEIIPGVNGCTMYDQCTTCHPIVYHSESIINRVGMISDEAGNYYEGLSIRECEIIVP